MATSRAGGAALRYLESRKNLTGCLCGLVGLALAATGLAGAYWPLVTAGLYAAGALAAPPGRPAAPHVAADGSAGLDALRADFQGLREYLAEIDVPAGAAGPAAEIEGLLAALLEPGWVAGQLRADPEAVHVIGRAVRQDLPEAFDAYQRTRWWSRLNPGAEPPERHLERQLALLAGELGRIAGGIRQSQERRQEIHTQFLEDRNPPPGPLTGGDPAPGP